MVVGDSVQEMNVQLGPMFKGGLLASAAAAARPPAEKPIAVAISLTDLPQGIDAIVAQIQTPEVAEERDLVLRLVEIGFVPGEEVRIVAEGFPGREPLAVRLGSTTFALRRFEAGFIRVLPRGKPAAA